MFEKLKEIHFMFYVSLAFIIFPIAGVLSGEYPLFVLFLTACFVCAYFNILIDTNQLRRNVSWGIMLAYLIYSFTFLHYNFIWFSFYLSNLLIYSFQERHFHSPRYLSFFLAQFVLLVAIIVKEGAEISAISFVLVTFLTVNIWMLGFQRLKALEVIKEEKSRQNAKINLLLAENERNRIGRDLHDSLGHTFAMLSLKSELARQILQMKDYDRLDKELAEMQEISKKSMQDVRRIIDNLKTRTLGEELETVQAMLEIADIKVSLTNDLNMASLPLAVQSSISMVLLELATNIIKHAHANHAKFHLFSEADSFMIDVEDNGRGFRNVTGKELHSIRERIADLSGQVKIISSRKPTRIRVILPNEGEQE